MEIHEQKVPESKNGKKGVSGVPRNFFRGEVQQSQLRTEGREKGTWGQ
jgi:hypothetical protein